MLREYNTLCQWMGTKYPTVGKANLSCNNNEYTLTMLVPGIDKKDVKINVEKNVLSVSYKHEDKSNDDIFYQEYTMESFNRTFKLTKDVDTNNIKANMTNGILEVKLPILETCKKINIDIE